MQERPAGSWEGISRDGQVLLRWAFGDATVQGVADAYPVCSAEVDGLGKVVSLIEATVVGSRKGDHKLSRTLIGSYDLQKKNGTLSEEVVGGATGKISSRV